MPRKAKPLQFDLATRWAIVRGHENCWRDLKRRRHWYALYLLSQQPPEEYSITAVTKKVNLSESRIRQLIARFQKEGVSFLERKYRHQDPVRKGRGRRSKLSKEELQLLSFNDDVLAGSLEDIRAWVLAWTGKTISLSTASRLRSKAREARQKIDKKGQRKEASQKRRSRMRKSYNLLFSPMRTVSSTPSRSIFYCGYCRKTVVVRLAKWSQTLLDSSPLVSVPSSMFLLKASSVRLALEINTRLSITAHLA